MIERFNLSTSFFEKKEIELYEAVHGYTVSMVALKATCFILSKGYYVDKQYLTDHLFDISNLITIICSYCGKRGDTLEVDHIIPISKGETDIIENLITSRRYCNRAKHNKDKIEFLK